jgi:hypothetical protein
VTFFKFCLGQAIVKLNGPESAMTIELAKGVNVDLSTCATRLCGGTIGVVIPSIDVNVLLRNPVENMDWRTVAELHTGGSFDIYNANRGWRRDAARQQAFLRKEDAETRRITYLYDDSKTSRYGQFSHQVFVPTPRPSNLESISDDEDTEYDSAATSVNSRSSSPESGGHDDMAFSRPRPRRSSTLRRERASYEVDSDDDESGSASTCSSASESDLRDPTDISATLADQLQQLRAFRQSMLDSMNLPDDGVSGGDFDLPPTSLRSGKVIKVSLVPVSLALQPIAMKAGAGLYEAFNDTVSLLL